MSDVDRELQAERALADDLSAVLALAGSVLTDSYRTVHRDIDAVLARYREARR